MCTMLSQCGTATAKRIGKFLKNPVQRVDITCPTTIATTTTTTKNSTTSAANNTSTITSTATNPTSTLRPPLDDNPKEGQSKLPDIIHCVIGVGGALVFNLLVLIFVKCCNCLCCKKNNSLVVCCLCCKKNNNAVICCLCCKKNSNFVVCCLCCKKKNKDSKSPASISMQEVVGGGENHPDVENMYARVDKSNKNQSPDNVSGMYAKVNKKNKKNQSHGMVSEMYAKVDKKNNKTPRNNSVSDMYAKVEKRKNSKLLAAAASNDYSNLDEFNEPQRAASGPKPPEDFSNMYAQVNKEPPKVNYTIYSEPGGGSVGHQLAVQPLIYVEAKEVGPQYSIPQKPSSNKPGSYKASSRNKEFGHDNPSISDYEEIIMKK